MPNVSDNHHLLRRGSAYYYHRRVPDDVAKVVGRSVVKSSLRTNDKKTAKKLRAVLDVEWDARFEAARSGPRDKMQFENGTGASSASSGIVSTYLADLARTHVEQVSARKIRALDNLAPADAVDRREAVENAAEDLARLLGREPTAEQDVETLGNHLLSEGAGTSGKWPPGLDALARRSLTEIAKRVVAHLQGDHQHRFFDALFDPDRAPSPTFGEFVEQFMEIEEEDAAVNGVSEKHVDQQRAYLDTLVEIVGVDTPVRSIDYDTCLRVRSMLARTPTNRRKVYGAMPLQRAIDTAAVEERGTLGAITQKQYLGTFRRLLDLAAKKRLIPVNFAQDLTPLKRDNVALHEKRLPFSQEQIARFFASEFYRQCARDRAGVFRTDRNAEWRFWLPLLCLFTGLRPNEVCQMHVADVKRTERGTWFLDVSAGGDEERSDGTGKTLKTKSSRRKVPLHPELLQVGFLELVAGRAGSGRLFVDLKPNKFGNLAWYPLKRFNEEFLPRAITMKDRQAFYSFRHSFRDALRRARATPDDLIALGWAQGRNVSDNYGERADPDMLAETIAKIRFERLELRSLYHNPR